MLNVAEFRAELVQEARVADLLVYPRERLGSMVLAKLTLTRSEMRKPIAAMVKMVDARLLEAAKVANHGAKYLRAARVVAKCMLLLPG